MSMRRAPTCALLRSRQAGSILGPAFSSTETTRDVFSARELAPCCSPACGASKPVSYTHLTLPTICSV
eukprot:7234344-Prorocentrum_lima.AAC.1